MAAKIVKDFTIERYDETLKDYFNFNKHAEDPVRSELLEIAVPNEGSASSGTIYDTEQLYDIQTAEHVKLQWDRIHTWMDENSPGMRRLLNPGVSEQAMKKLKEKLELHPKALTEDFEESYLIHNGATAKFFWGSEIANSFLSIDDILRHWLAKKKEFDAVDIQDLYFERTAKCHDNVRNKRWSKKWIPFGSDGLNDLLCIDLEPMNRGNYGQVVHWAPGKNYTAYRAPNFAKYLDDFATHLENGIYRLSGDGKYLISSLCKNQDQYNDEQP